MNRNQTILQYLYSRCWSYYGPPLFVQTKLFIPTSCFFITFYAKARCVYRANPSYCIFLLPYFFIFIIHISSRSASKKNTKYVLYIIYIIIESTYRYNNIIHIIICVYMCIRCSKEFAAVAVAPLKDAPIRFQLLCGGIYT